MTEEQLILWEKIKNFELDEPQIPFSFTDRLARENGWKLDYASRAVFEYKRFIFLLCDTKKHLTPSDEVDQVWHLHLIYTRSYWIDFCRNTLQQEIHHGPTKGGGLERDKFKDWYNETRQQYAIVFGQNPPKDIWPSGQKRFKELNFRRVNVAQYWIIKKPDFKNEN